MRNASLEWEAIKNIVIFIEPHLSQKPGGEFASGLWILLTEKWFSAEYIVP